MFHTNRHDVIESDDIQDVQHVHIAQEDGKPVAFIKAILDPRKDYQALKDVFVHLYNGINQPRMLGPFEHAQTIETPVPSVTASIGGQTLTATEPQGTAEGSPDVNATSDTVQLPSVKGKGN
jgi:hypothetical protein